MDLKWVIMTMIIIIVIIIITVVIVEDVSRGIFPGLPVSFLSVNLYLCT